MKTRILFSIAVMILLAFSLPNATATAQIQDTPQASNAVSVAVQTIIESSIFPNNVTDITMAVGDLTNDGSLDLVFVKGAEQYGAGAAVFQNPGGIWNSGTLLAGPSLNSAKNPIVAPIRNDGKNWLVFSEHVSGNGGEWLRGYRYSGTALVENKDVTSRFAWPGWFAPSVADLDGDGNLEIWFVTLHGGFPNPHHHLFRYVWNSATNTYQGVEIKDGGQNFEPLLRPQSGDFLGDGTQTLIWVAQSRQLDLVSYTPGSGVYDHTSYPIFTPSGAITSISTGEFDGNSGTDIAAATWDGSSSSVYVISGDTFTVTQVASGVGEYLTVVCLADLDDDSLAEVYAAGAQGGIYGFDSIQGWRLITSQPGINWRDGMAARWTGTTRDEVLISGLVGGRTFRVVSLTAETKILGSNVNIYNIINGTGDGSSPDTFYGFEVFVRAHGDFSNFDATHVTLTVDGDPLTLDHARISYDGTKFRIAAGGDFDGIPPLGEYVVTIEDASGQISEPFVIGNLEDFPKDAPDILFPEHQSTMIDTQPAFNWEAFNSSYLGQPVAPWAYEIDLGFPNGDQYVVFPIDETQTTLNFENPGWDPIQPPALEAGVYGLTVHSNHQVIPGFNFEHHRSINFEVVPSNQPPTANAGPDQTIFEGDSVTLDASGSSDPDNNITLYEWDLDNDGEYDDFTGITTEWSFADDGAYTLGLRVTDEGGLSDEDATTITVNNAAPKIESLTAPITPMQVGSTVSINASFTDPGTADTHTALLDWGDGSTSDGLISGYSVTDAHVYTVPGVYTVTLTVTDDDGGSDTESFQYVVIYDPNGGFVTGGGWINSPVGAYIPDPSLTGKATFGFVSKYQKGANIPTGNTEFQFKVADLNFKSVSYDWLVIAGTKAQYKGTGTINGLGEYKFMLTAVDGTSDKFRIKIWDVTTGDIVYDNMLGATDTDDPVTALGGGSIVIHKEK